MLYRIFQKIEPSLKGFYRRISEPPIPNLKGDRDIEYSWIAANMPEGPGEALDFGSGPSYMGLIAVRKGFNVTAVDIEPVKWFYKHPNFKFIQGDIFKLEFSPAYFDLIINCSTIEHVGLAGCYRITESRPDGDIEAMKILKTILKPNGTMLLTIPVGRDKVFTPLHRVYGQERLPKLLEGWKVLKKEFWIKDDQNRWICVDESVALNKEPVEHCYGLGLFVLRKPIGGK
jgi:SAM-dependent methyltransferase